MKKLLLAIVTLMYAVSAVAQNADDMTVIRQHIQVTETSTVVHVKSAARIQKTYNPVKLVLYLPLFCYQRFVSEQLSSSCSFEPSCSAFSILCIKKLGIFEGLLLTADRLTRCNGHAQAESQDYLFDPIKAKVIDVPEMYRSIH